MEKEQKIQAGDPCPGDLWRHFKGTLYRIVCIARDCETLKHLVVYQDVNNPEKIWVRDKEAYLGKHPEHNVDRFVLVTRGE